MFSNLVIEGMIDGKRNREIPRRKWDDDVKYRTGISSELKIKLLRKSQLPTLFVKKAPEDDDDDTCVKD